jgi:hypothetical protein
MWSVSSSCLDALEADACINSFSTDKHVASGNVNTISQHYNLNIKNKLLLILFMAMFFG